MKRKHLLFFILWNCLVFGQKAEYFDKVEIKPYEGIMIKSKSAAKIEIENISDNPIMMESVLKIPPVISPKSNFTYFFPKKGVIYFYNSNQNEIIINIKAKTNKKLIIENLNTFRINEDKLSHY